jgi:hypothetical protein
MVTPEAGGRGGGWRQKREVLEGGQRGAPAGLFISQV